MEIVCVVQFILLILMWIDRRKILKSQKDILEFINCFDAILRRNGIR